MYKAKGNEKMPLISKVQLRISSCGTSAESLEIVHHAMAPDSCPAVCSTLGNYGAAKLYF